MRSTDVQEPKDLEEDINVNAIHKHLLYFRAVCSANSIGGAAQLMRSARRTVLNHLKWIECLTGEKLLKKVRPGQTMQLSAFGEELKKDVTENVEEAAKKLNKNKMDGVINGTYTTIIQFPHTTYSSPQTPDRIAINNPANKETDERSPTSTDQG